MAKHLGEKLTEGSVRLLGATNSERDNCVILLLTVDDDGYPRVCLLSPYQIVATSPSNLYFEVYTQSHTSQNVDRSGKVTLVIPESTGLLYVYGNAKRFKENLERLGKSQAPPIEETKNTLYRLSITRVESDVSGVAPIDSQMTFDISTIGAEYRREFEVMKRKIKEE